MKFLFLVIGITLTVSSAWAISTVFNNCTGCPDYTGTSTRRGVAVYPASATASFPFGLSASTITGAGLGVCGDATHAAGITSTGTFKCQAIVGSGGAPA